MDDNKTLINEAVGHMMSWGFVGEDGGWNRRRSGKYRTRLELSKDGKGFLRYEFRDGVWRQYPYSMHRESTEEGDGGCEKNHNGLAFDVKQQVEQGGIVRPSCFDWIHPVEWVIEQYSNPMPIQEK